MKTRGDLALELDAAYQPLMQIELELRKSDQFIADADLSALGERVWTVVEELQRIRRELEEGE